MKTLKVALFAAVLGLTPTISKPADDPLEGLGSIHIDIDRLCHEGICVVPEQLFVGIASANVALQNALKTERDRKTKQCATVVPIPNGRPI